MSVWVVSRVMRHLIVLGKCSQRKTAEEVAFSAAEVS